MKLLKMMAFLVIASLSNLNAQSTDIPTKNVTVKPAEDIPSKKEKALSEKEIINLRLFDLVENGDSDEIKKLIKSNAIDYYRHNPNGETLLTLAIKNNDVATTKLLVQDAVINLKNEDGETPLTLAIKAENPSMTRLILKRAKASYKNSIGEAPLFLAIMNKDINLAQKIIKKGGDVNRYTNGITPLALATSLNDYKMVSYLIKNGAEVSQPNKDGQIPLFLAISHRSDVIAGILISKSKDPFTDANWKDNIGDPIISEAAKHGNPQIIKMLINAGSDVNDLDYEENTPLHIAAAYGKTSAVSQLLQFDAQIDAINIRGCSPLIVAGQNHQKDSYDFLRENGAKTATLDYLGYNAKNYINSEISDHNVIVEK